MALPETPEDSASFATDFMAPAYAEHHYARASTADNAVTRYIINTITRSLASHFGSFDSLFEIGNAGVLRSSALAAPLLAPDARVVLTDVGESQMTSAREAIGRVQQGELGIWGVHQKVMERVDRRWKGAVSDLCCRDNIGVAFHDILEAPVPPSRLRVEAHTLCSHTDDPGAYGNSVENFFCTMEAGDVAIRLFDVGSTGYQVGGRQFPGFPIDKASACAEAKEHGLMVLGAEEYTFCQTLGNHANHTASTLTALGGAVLMKPHTQVVVA